MPEELSASDDKPIDKGTGRRLALGFVSNLVSKFANTIVQFVQVPVFLSHWDVKLYGEWMIINSIPSYLALSSIGFGSVAGNEMAMLTAAGEREKALGVFQSCWWLIACICAVVSVLLGVVLYFVEVSTLLNLHAISISDSRWIVFYLGLSVLLGQFEQLLGAAYTCIGKYAYGSFIKSVITLIAFGAMMVPVLMHMGPRTTAGVFAAANALGTVVLGLLVRRDIPWIRYGWQYARWSEIKRMSSPALAFMGFPLGNALNLQGTLMVVGYALGPLDVVIFGTARTVSRVALQMVQMVNFTFWPEISMAYGARNTSLIRTLHRTSCQLALAVAALILAAMMSLGPWFLTHWTAGHVPPSRPLLAILLLVVVFYALWSTSSTVAAATNQHQKLSFYYIVGTSVTIVFTYLFAVRYGLYGAAASLLISELIMNTYVIPNSLRLTQDSFPAFLASMVQMPTTLHPVKLWQRFRRPVAVPDLEN